ncbi:endonuclease domain-containing protein [Micromonospora sp. b486]|uniref:endonuclease domain-containing protein n=1 Tax=unclassified Micromonospora TaxID=2617518 RepID=UPI00338D92A8
MAWIPGPRSPLGRVRAVLAGTLGGSCHACRSRPGTSVDHDHLTNRVRGLLCLPCNNQIDFCMHASGCAFADYLNHPPAAGLNLAYPQPERLRHSSVDDLRIALLGFDPRYGRGRRRGRASERPSSSPDTTGD